MSFNLSQHWTNGHHHEKFTCEYTHEHTYKVLIMIKVENTAFFYYSLLKVNQLVILKGQCMDCMHTHGVLPNFIQAQLNSTQTGPKLLRCSVLRIWAKLRLCAGCPLPLALVYKIMCLSVCLRFSAFNNELFVFSSKTFTLPFPIGEQKAAEGNRFANMIIDW